MPTITLPVEYDLKLKKLVDDPFAGLTRELIIGGLIDAELARREAAGPQGTAEPGANAIRLDPNGPGPLVHTKLLQAVVDGRAILRPKWNGVRERMHVIGWN